MPNKQQRERKSARKRAQQQTTGGYDSTVFRVPEGIEEMYLKDDKTRRLEILPFKAGQHNEGADPGEWTYELTYYMHRNVGAEENRYVCPRKMGVGKCPICDHRAKLGQDPDADEDLIKDLQPKKRQLFWVIDHAVREKGVMVWDMSYHLFGKLLAARITKDAEDEEPEGYEYFYDEVDGFTLRLGVTEQKMMYKFLEVTDIDFKKRKGPIPQKFIDATTPLSDMLIIKPYDELHALYHQTEGGTAATVAEDWAGDDTPGESNAKANAAEKSPKQADTTSAKTASPSRAKPDPAPADDDGWGDDDDGWGDDDATPAADAAPDASPAADDGEYEDAEEPSPDPATDGEETDDWDAWD